MLSFLIALLIVFCHVDGIDGKAVHEEVLNGELLFVLDQRQNKRWIADAIGAQKLLDKKLWMWLLALAEMVEEKYSLSYLTFFGFFWSA